MRKDRSDRRLDGYFAAWISNEPEILAVEGDTGIAHRNVTARAEGETARSEWDGILLITFAPDGRCREHREWLVRGELYAG